MRQRHIQIAALVTGTCWAAFILHQVYFLNYAWRFLFKDTGLDEFLLTYGIQSSIESVVITVVGVILSVVVFRHASAWAALGLAILAVGVFWKYYLAGLPIHFQPPRADGTLSRPLENWWRLHSSLILVHSLKAVFLLLSSVYWAVSFKRLRLLETKSESA